MRRRRGASMAAFGMATLMQIVSAASALTPSPTRTPTRVPTVTTDRGRWEAKAPMLTPRNRAFIAAVGGQIYAFGGWLQTVTPNTRSLVGEVYDPLADEWRAGSPMLRARAAGFTVAVNDTIYAIGGSYDDSSAGTLVEVYDTRTDSWSERSPKVDVVPDAILAAAWFRDRIYLLVRAPGVFDRVFAYAYDPQRDTWTNLPPLALSQFDLDLSLQVSDDKLLLFAAAERRVYRYEPDAGVLQERSEIPNLRGFFSSLQTASAGRGVYGFVGDVDHTVLEYNPAKDSWRGPLEDAPSIELGFASQVVPVSVNGDPRIYAIGGFSKAFNAAYFPPRALSVPTSTPTATASPPAVANTGDGCAVVGLQAPKSEPSWLPLCVAPIALLARSLLRRSAKPAGASSCRRQR